MKARLLVTAALLLGACGDGASFRDADGGRAGVSGNGGAVGGAGGTTTHGGAGGSAGGAGGTTAHGGTGGSAGNASGGTGGVVGEGANTCGNASNTPGRIVDLAWPAASNVGHDAVEGDTVRFHWVGSHNVLQVATFEGQVTPVGTYGDAGWDRELRSGDKKADGSFDWNVGTFPCGYRPGIYFFVDQDNPGAGITSATLTVKEGGTHYAPRPCSALTDASFYGGRYAGYANRPGCTVFEVNNFQTQAHFDWVPPIFTLKQGDLIVFRWTGIHNVVQVHDVTKDAPVSGGFNSGAKTNCVGGPNYLCANGPSALGEFLIDTKDYRPGTIHISDECALTCTGHTTGMNMEFDLRFPVPNNTPLPPVVGSCCSIDRTKGAACRVVEIYNANDGAQFDYNVPVGRGDLVRFRWAGKLRIYQSTPNANGSPSKTAKPGGLAMAAPVECTPGPQMSCLEGTTDAAQLIMDVNKEIGRGNVESNASGQKSFDFQATGENTPGFTSADTGTLLYVDEQIPYNPTPAPCP
jgi:plastocyanin